MYIIGGPTASGKSAFALELANQLRGEIINGDSMQLYHHLHILTARPSDSDTKIIPHHLYGILAENQKGSVEEWYKLTTTAIQDIQARGKTPIIVGGTGLYLRTLTHGLSPIPEISPSIRKEARLLAQSLSSQDFYTQVIHEDPKMKNVLHVNDVQRLIRALEVIRSTKVSLKDWQGHPQKKINLPYKYFLILPPRTQLYERINHRFSWMIEKGGLEEVNNLLSQKIDPTSPILKAIGVRELSRYIQGEISLSDAILQGQQSTRQYAKRQITWFTNQVTHAEIISDPKKAFEV